MGEVSKFTKELEIGLAKQIIIYRRYDYIQVKHNVNYSEDRGRLVK
jgi:hypothetical protein